MYKYLGKEDYWKSMTVCDIREHTLYLVNPYHAEFLKWNNPPSILALSIIIFWDIKMKT